MKKSYKIPNVLRLANLSAKLSPITASKHGAARREQHTGARLFERPYGLNLGTEKMSSGAGK
jgi:hypothetical protein